MGEALSADDDALAQAVDACWSEAKAAEAHWTQALLGSKRPPIRAIGGSAAIAWSRLSIAAGLPPGAA